METSFGLDEQVDHFLLGSSIQEFLAQGNCAEAAAQNGEHVQVLRQVGRADQQEQVDGLVIDRAERDAFIVPAKDQDRIGEKGGLLIAGVRQGNPFADAGAVHAFAFEDSLSEFFALLRLGLQFPHTANELAYDFIAVATNQL